MRGAAGAGPTRPADLEAPTLGVRPGLDGIRGVAIVLVVLTHIWVLSGGFIGVDLFFVLSGFLITTLLLEERARTGGVRLKRFYARRAYRLLPALFLLLPLGWITRVVYPQPLASQPYWLGVVGALAYVNNWIQVHDSSDLRALAHTWSLAVEEQFYLLWPTTLLLSLRRWRREWVLLRVAAAVTAFSLAYMMIMQRVDPQHNLYVSTLTRAGELVLGGAVSVLWRRHRLPRFLSSPAAAILCVIAIAAISWTAEIHSPWLYNWAGLYVGAACGVVAVACVLQRPAGVVGRFLELPPLRYTGRISYSMYLFNYPLTFLLSPAVLGIATPYTDLCVIAATWGLAAASYHLVERPIMRWARSRERPDATGAARAAAHLPAGQRPGRGAPAAADPARG